MVLVLMVLVLMVLVPTVLTVRGAFGTLGVAVVFGATAFLGTGAFAGFSGSFAGGAGGTGGAGAGAAGVGSIGLSAGCGPLGVVAFFTINPQSCHDTIR
jgi:hypothetical protein